MRLGLIADVHLGPPGTPASSWHGPIEPAAAKPLVQASVARLSRLRIDAVALLGDLSQLGDRASAEWVIRCCRALDRPIFVVAGNHDLAPDDANIRDACLAAKATYLAGDGVEWSPGLWLAAPWVERRGECVRGVPMAERPLIGDALLVCLSHYPLLSRRRAADAAGVRYPDDLLGGASVASGFVRQGPAVCVHGHTHFHDRASWGGLLQLGVPALSDPVHEVAVLDVVGAPAPAAMLETWPVATATAAPQAVVEPHDGRWRFDGRRRSWRLSEVGEAVA